MYLILLHLSVSSLCAGTTSTGCCCCIQLRACAPGHQRSGGLSLASNYRSQEALLALLHAQHGEDDSHLSEASQRDHLEMRAAPPGSVLEGEGCAGPLSLGSQSWRDRSFYNRCCLIPLFPLKNSLESKSLSTAYKALHNRPSWLLQAPPSPPSCPRWCCPTGLCYIL